MRILVGLLWLCVTSLSFAAELKVTDLRSSSVDGKTRFVVDLSSKPSFRNFALSKPPRIVIDINDAVMNTKVNQAELDNTAVKDIRFSTDPSGKLRLVFDLIKDTANKVFLLPPTGDHGYRLVIDITSVTSNVAEKSTSITRPQAVTTANDSTDTDHNKLRDIVIILDPGHGGKDPGASGPKGSKEKNVVLAIAKELKRQIDNEPGFRAVLTRSRDVYLPLRKRLALARDVNPDMYVSIHADAFKTAKARGASIFALSARGATSEAARWLAEKDNSSQLMGGVELSDKDSILRSVLLDLSQTHTISVSLQIGTAVLHQMSRAAKLHNDRVDQAAFVVLKSPDIPSILIETGFLSNPEEEKLLNDRKYQRELSSSIMRGIKSYFMANSIPGTLIASRSSGKPGQHIVVEGDTLFAIAQRYRVSVNDIKKINKIGTGQLKRGQVIRIPA